MTIVFRVLHGVWAIVGVSATAMFITSTNGHPPGIVFTPFVMTLWAVGHVFLVLSQKLAATGRQLADRRNNESRKWPLTLLVLGFFCGGAFVFGLLAFVFKIFLTDNWLKHFPTLIVLWLPPSICFIGILLRRDWSRILASGGLLIAAAFLLFQMVESATGFRGNSILEWVIGILILILLLFLGLHVLRSSKVKAFLR